MFRQVDQIVDDRAPSLLAMAEPARAHRAGPAVDQEAGPPRRRSGLLSVIGLTLAGAVAGGALSAVWPQSYVATSEMMLAPSVQVASSSVGFSAETAHALIENQLRVFRSGSVLNAAVDRLNLVADNEFNGNDAGPFGMGGALANFSNLVAADGVSMVDDRRSRTLENLARSIDVRRVDASPVVAVSAKSSDPEKSALIANTLADLFLADLGGATASAAATAKLEDLRAEVAASERAVATFRAQNGLLASAEEIDILAEKLASARARTVALNVQVAAARNPGLDMMSTGSVISAPTSLEDIRARFAAQKQRVEGLSARLGPRHPELISAEAELVGIQRELDAETRHLSSVLQTDLANAVREEQDLAARVAQVKDQGEGADDKLSMLRSLERAVETRRAALEETIRSAGQRPEATAGTRILSAAEAPAHGSAPSMPALSLAGAAAGLFAGLSLTGWRRDKKNTGAPMRDDGWDQPASRNDNHYTDEWDEARDHLPEADYHAKEAEAMYPYPPQGYHAAQAYGRQPEPEYPAQYPQQPYAPQGMAPGWYPPAPHDPWAQQGYPAPVVYAQPGYPQAYPVPAAYQAYPQAPYTPVAYMPAPHVPMQQSYQRIEQLDRNAYIDRRTDAVLEEIRHSLRALREAIEDIADDRYGT